MNDANVDVAIVGLGDVGMVLGRRLLASGLAVRGYDIDATRMNVFATIGGMPAARIEDALACRTIVLAVGNDTRIADVVSHPIAEGATIVDTVTGAPAFAETLARALSARRVAYLDAPLMGSRTQIANGDALAVVGGDAQTIDWQRTLLALMARTTTHFGRAGAGRAAKLATSLILGLTRGAFAEGLGFAERMGLDARRFAEFIGTSPASAPAAQAKGARMLSRNYAPEWRVRQQRDDLALILDAAKRSGARTELAEAHAALLDAAIGEGYGDLDDAGIVEHYRRDGIATPP